MPCLRAARNAAACFLVGRRTGTRWARACAPNSTRRARFPSRLLGAACRSRVSSSRGRLLIAARCKFDDCEASVSESRRICRARETPDRRNMEPGRELSAEARAAGGGRRQQIPIETPGRIPALSDSRADRSRRRRARGFLREARATGYLSVNMNVIASYDGKSVLRIPAIALRGSYQASLS